MASQAAPLPRVQGLIAGEPSVGLESWKGMAMRWQVVGAAEGGDHPLAFTQWSLATAEGWSKATAEHWEIPLVAVVVYLLLIPALKRLVSRRGAFDVKRFAFWWNASLSLFSWFGVAACVPVLASSLWEHGLYFTTCAPAQWYASGPCGLFVALFVYSKLAELLDTVLLLLAGKPVLALQWWHHSTVLLYCWHSYSVRIATGLWFASMNYAVHSVMYGYFAAMGSKYRKSVSRYAIYITLLQLAQMLVGMFVTVRAVMYQAAGEECHVQETNSALGLSMYASYFVLFLKLFVDNYYRKPKGPARKRSVREAVRSMSRKMTQHVLDEAEEESHKDEDGPPPPASGVKAKKVN